MNWLFIHQNFPAQFVHAARYLAEHGDTVVFITQQRERQLPGVRKIVYVPQAPPHGVHPFIRDFDAGVENGLAVARLHPDEIALHAAIGVEVQLAAQARDLHVGQLLASA